jgi:Domain of unknown function (DUF4304)
MRPNPSFEARPNINTQAPQGGAGYHPPCGAWVLLLASASIQTLGVIPHMAQSLTASAIGAASKAALAALTHEGFKRRAPHLFRRSHDVLHCIHFQSSKWGTASEGQFTVNLVVTWVSVFEAWTGKPLPANPATASYPIQQRIGHCLPNKLDKWWSVGGDTDPEVLAQEVGMVIAQLAPGFFEPFSSTLDVLVRVRDTKALPGLTRAQAALVHAHLAHVAGSGHEAEDILAAELKLAANSPFKSSIRSFAQRAGINLRQ